VQLVGNQIKITGATALSEALKSNATSNTTLTSLN
jgi:hypothetical protein